MASVSFFFDAILEGVYELVRRERSSTRFRPDMLYDPLFPQITAFL